MDCDNGDRRLCQELYQNVHYRISWIKSPREKIPIYFLTTITHHLLLGRQFMTAIKSLDTNTYFPVGVQHDRYKSLEYVS
jgi:hypothetical protein